MSTLFQEIAPGYLYAIAIGTIRKHFSKANAGQSNETPHTLHKQETNNRSKKHLDKMQYKGVNKLRKSKMWKAAMLRCSATRNGLFEVEINI